MQTSISNNLIVMKNENFKKLFGSRIRYLRNLAELSQEKLAERVGLSTKTISYIENGKNTISFNKLQLIADGLGVPVYKLFVFTDYENHREMLEKLLISATDKEINAISEIVKIVLAIK